MSAPETPAVTPGQAAYEAWAARLGDADSPMFADLDLADGASWADVAQAATETVRQFLGRELQSASRTIERLMQESDLAARQPQPAPGTCWLPCDPDCEVGPVHCWNAHRPSHKPDWHDPDTCTASPAAAQPAPGETELRRRIEDVARGLDHHVVAGSRTRMAVASSSLARILRDILAETAAVPEPQPAPGELAVALRALRTIAWGATPDLKPINPAAVADKALVELRDMGVSITGGALPEQPAPELADSRPASMLQPVTFDDSADESDLRHLVAVPELAAAMAESRRYREALESVRAILLEDAASTEHSRLRRSRAVIRAALEGKS